jgi:kynurenine formamidase
MPRLVDLSRLMDPANRELMPPEFEFLKTIIAPEIEYLTPSEKGLDRVLNAFGCTPEDLPDHEGWGEEWMHLMNTHCGTHVDAPLHSGNRIEGKPARTISDIDLQELYRPGMVLDLREHVAPGEGITIAALDAAIEANGKPVEAGDAVLLRTGQERYTMADPEFFRYPGMTGDSTRYLTGLGATILGTDALAWDRPFPVMRAAFEATGDKNEIWDGHFAIRDREAFIVQQMTNLGALPAHGFTVGFFPLNLPKTSAAPARVVAFLDD